MTKDGNRRIGEDKTVDAISALIGGIGEKVDGLADTVKTLAITITTQHEETIKYRALNDVKIAALSDVVDEHEKIASHINLDHLDEINNNHEFVRYLRAKADFWSGLGERMLSNAVEKSLWMFTLIVLGALLYTFAPDLAKKLNGFID